MLIEDGIAVRLIADAAKKKPPKRAAKSWN
jgi:hypothetical protein